MQKKRSRFCSNLQLAIYYLGEYNSQTMLLVRPFLDILSREEFFGASALVVFQYDVFPLFREHLLTGYFTGDCRQGKFHFSRFPLAQWLYFAEKQLRSCTVSQKNAILCQLPIHLSKNKFSFRVCKTGRLPRPSESVGCQNT